MKKLQQLNLAIFCAILLVSRTPLSANTFSSSGVLFFSAHGIEIDPNSGRTINETGMDSAYAASGGLNDADNNNLGSFGAAYSSSLASLGAKFTAGALSHGGFAEAEVQETWHGNPGLASVPMSLTIHFDGRYDLSSSPGCPPSPAGSVEMHYDFFDPGSRSDLSFYLARNGAASFGGQDLSQLVTYDPVTGVTKFDYSTNFLLHSNEWSEYRRIDVMIDRSRTGAELNPCPATTDFYSTFTAQAVSLDPNITFQSDGRPVPEPCTLLLLPALLSIRSRRWASAREKAPKRDS